jgi:hypothetical protein
MNLHGSITELQNAIVQLYHKLQQRFIENRMISELWSAMANDISQQVSSLNVLPSSFWNRLKNERDGLVKAVGSGVHPQFSEKAADLSLRSCIELSLHIEEPIILKTYVPIIRSMRENQANQSLDFYIMVKAHLARIARITQSFSGDPLVIQRSNLLLQSFEKEVQEPQATAARKLPAAVYHISSASKIKHKAKPTRPIAKRISRPLAKRSLSRPGRTKPLVKKVEIRRRRVQR